MELPPQQKEAYDKVGRWYERGSDQVFHFFGYAGTGKTTLAKHLAESIEGKVMYGAFTGKAAYVLRSKGCADASTIHSMIYNTRDKSKAKLRDLEESLSQLIHELQSEGSDPEKHKRVHELRAQVKEETVRSSGPSFTLNEDSEVNNCDLVIIDECSMVNAQMGEDLLSFGKKVLVLGDPAQLPPVGGEGYFTHNVKPDVMLDEVHRQAKDSAILRMATQVRNQEPLLVGDYGQGCEVMNHEHRFTPEEILSYDQILVGRNKTRHSYNSRIRKIKGIEDAYPVPGDRVICLRNDNEEGLLNGAIFGVHDTTGIVDEKVTMEVQQEDSEFTQEVIAHEHHFLGRSDDLKWYQRKEAQEFDYGYAITTHKSQGSQWENVLVTDESKCFREHKWNWLYTAITRASNTVKIYRP